MSNICDYIKWRGDLTLEQDKFNEVDALILARFSYLPFDNIIEENEIVTIKELSKRFKKQDISKLPILWPDDKELFPLMGKSKRFGEMKATQYINKISIEKEQQFSVITILLPDNTIYVSYRGTDNTIVGWKEDFIMSFKSHITSQIDSIKYLEEIVKQYKKEKIRIGGHSKGGNLAIYASTFASEKVKNRIINIYNADGPGFEKEILETEEYKEVLDKIHSYIPQSSIIGRILNNKGKYTIVKSTQKGIMQHDLYTWQLKGKEFISIDELTNESKIIDETLTALLDNTEPEEREKVINVVFDMLYKTDAETVGQIRKKWFTNSRIMLKYYKNVDDETKEIIIKTIHEILKIAKGNITRNSEKR